jgi:hypothetical protein
MFGNIFAKDNIELVEIVLERDILDHTIGIGT